MVIAPNNWLERDLVPRRFASLHSAYQAPQPGR